MYEILKDYRCDKALRDSFNDLAGSTFGGLNFEGWYQNGFWGDNYNPHSIVLDGKVVANVSVNRTDLLIGGQRKKIFQLGTVMTDPAYRNRGLIRAIMEEVNRELADADGVYLFGNDNVVDFYPKFGFRGAVEWQYSKTVNIQGNCRVEQVIMGNPDAWAVLQKAMEENTYHPGCDMVGNPDLIFFYVSQFIQDAVYYCRDLDAWIIAEPEENRLMLHNVFCKNEISLDDVIAAFGSGVEYVTLGFAPVDPEGWTVEEYREEDCNFFVRGAVFDTFQQQKLRIPSLSHA